jgi:phytoene desaturase
MEAAIRSHVRSPYLIQLLSRFATYVGANPYQAPATLNLIAHVELGLGIWYPHGGVYSIAEALAKLAAELGVEIHLGVGVKQILVEQGRACGIETTTGQQVRAAAVLANVDVATVYEKLLPAGAVPAQAAGKFKEIAQSCSGFIMMLGIEGEHPQLAHHNLFFSNNYAREFDQIFEAGQPPDDPSIYISITSKTDSQDAPAGHENWFVLVCVPATSESKPYNWATQTEPYGQRVLACLAARGLDVRQKIRSQRLLAPPDLEKLTGARGGALYGGSSNQAFSAFSRPHNRAGLKGLYFAGGTTHPGGGVPMVVLSGAVAARLLQEDLAK